MKKAIVTLACALVVPLAFAQTSSTGKGHKGQGSTTTTTTEPITVTGTFIKMTTEEGAAASYQPAKTLVVRTDNANNPDRYVLYGAGLVSNKMGQIVKTPIKPGTRLRIYYTNMGEMRVVDHVEVAE